MREQARTLLKQAAAWHRDLADVYEAGAQQGQTVESIHHLCELLAKHERNLAAGVDEFLTQHDDELPDRIFRYTPEALPGQPAALLNWNELSGKQLLECAVAQGREMIGWYHRLEETVPPTRVKEMLQQLADKEMQQLKEMTTSIQGYLDTQ